MPETSEKILAQLGDGKVTEKPEILSRGWIWKKS